MGSVCSEIAAVSLPGDANSVHVTTLRHTGATQLFILADVQAFSEDSFPMQYVRDRTWVKVPCIRFN